MIEAMRIMRISTNPLNTEVKELFLGKNLFNTEAIVSFLGENQGKFLVS